jgi:uncharacterized protein YbjT (DUF2867 family)
VVGSNPTRPNIEDLFMNLVIGATGSVGSAVVTELSSRGLEVRALVRESNNARKILGEPGKVELLEGSAENPQALTTAFEGVDIVFNCLNLPYPEWSKLPAIHEQILNAAKRASAKMVFLETCTSMATHSPPK